MADNLLNKIKSLSLRVHKDIEESTTRILDQVEKAYKDSEVILQPNSLISFYK